MALTDKDLDFTVWAIMDVSPDRAYEAVADPAQLTAHFTTGGAKGHFEAGNTLTWEFEDFPGAFDVKAVEADSPRLLIFDWPHPSSDGMKRVTFRFEPVESDRCQVSVTESGWTADAAGLSLAFGNCMGWTHMLASMKAWLDHGIRLRQGMFR